MKQILQGTSTPLHGAASQGGDARRSAAEPDVDFGSLPSVPSEPASQPSFLLPDPPQRSFLLPDPPGLSPDRQGTSHASEDEPPASKPCSASTFAAGAERHHEMIRQAALVRAALDATSTQLERAEAELEEDGEGVFAGGGSRGFSISIRPLNGHGAYQGARLKAPAAPTGLTYMSEGADSLVDRSAGSATLGALSQGVAQGTGASWYRRQHSQHSVHTHAALSRDPPGMSSHAPSPVLPSLGGMGGMNGGGSGGTRAASRAEVWGGLTAGIEAARAPSTSTALQAAATAAGVPSLSIKHDKESSFHRPLQGALHHTHAQPQRQDWRRVEAEVKEAGVVAAAEADANFLDVSLWASESVGSASSAARTPRYTSNPPSAPAAGGVGSRDGVRDGGLSGGGQYRTETDRSSGESSMSYYQQGEARRCVKGDLAALSLYVGRAKRWQRLLELTGNRRRRLVLSRCLTVLCEKAFVGRRRRRNVLKGA